MTRSAIKHLDIVLLLLREQRKEFNRIKKTTYKRMGLCTVRYSDEEKAEQIRKTQNQYKHLIGDVYKHLNAELETDGREPLINPFI